MYENPYKKLREDFEFLPNGYRLSQKQLAKEFQDDTKAYYCSTLKYEAIRKIETDKRNVSDFEMKAYRLRFNTTADYLLGFTSVKYRGNENLEMIENTTGLSNDAIEMLIIWKKELDQHNKLLPALGNDTEIINILLEHQLERQKKATDKGYLPSWSIFHYIKQYLSAVKFKRELQDRIRICDGKNWIDIENGDTLIKGNEYYTIQNKEAINSKSGSGTNNKNIHIVNSEDTTERYVVEIDKIFCSYSKDNIFRELDKIKEYWEKKQ